jgi:hypothetical protein
MSSSTSSFELTPHERLRPGRVPVAALVFLALVACVEILASAHEEWFADIGSWQWRSKRALLDAGTLDGDVAIFGTSVLANGLDPDVVNRGSGRERAVNLALDGMSLQHMAQLLRERAASAAAPRLAVLEFREVFVAQDTWYVGPYFRFSATGREFLESRFFYFNPSLALAFVENRLSTVFRHRDGVRNWIVESVRSGAPSRRRRDGNRILRSKMEEHAGWTRPEVEDWEIEWTPTPGRSRPWRVNAAGELWLRRFLDTAASHDIRVALLLPPSPPPPRLVETPGPGGFRARFNAHVEHLRHQYPGLDLEVFEPGGFALDDFADEIHVNPRGRAKLSTAFAAWLSDYRQRHRLE